MKARALLIALAAGFLVLGFGALDARAGMEIHLPSTLDKFTADVTNFTLISSTAPFIETDRFDNFAYSTDPVGHAPSAANITMNEFHAGNEAGITFSGGFFALPNELVDYHLSFDVHAGAGNITDAILTGVFNIPAGSTGFIVNLGETITDKATGQVLGQLSIDPGHNTGTPIILLNGGAPVVHVEKDLLVFGGTGGAGISVFNEGFSSNVVPEPASLALLGIGMTGFLAFRRFFKKTSVA
jgi:hypothetical protein